MREDHATMQRHCNRHENRVKAQRFAGPRRPSAGADLGGVSLALVNRLPNDGDFVLDSPPFRRLTPEIQERPV